MDIYSRTDGVEMKSFFFTITFILWYATEILFNTTLESVFGIPISLPDAVCAWIVWGMLMLQIMFFQKYTFKELVVIVLATILLATAVILSGYNTIMSAWMFVVAAKGIDFERIIQIAYRILLVLIPTVFLLYAFGIADDFMMYRGGIVRHSLGFSHPNQLGLRVFQMIVCYYYIHREQIKWKDIMVGIAAALFVFLVPNSQTSYICILVFVILTLIHVLIKGRWRDAERIMGTMMIVGYMILNGLSVLFSVIGTGEYTGLDKLDRFLSIRFSASHAVIDLYGISIFGQKVYISEAERRLVGITRRLWLDNAYLAILVRYGVIVYLLFSLFYLYGMIYYHKKQKWFMLIIMFVFALYGLMENGLFQLMHNIFLLALSHVLYARDIIQDEMPRKKRFKVVFRPRMVNMATNK